MIRLSAHLNPRRSMPNQSSSSTRAEPYPHEMQTIITRAGGGPKVVLTATPYQIDNPYIDSSTTASPMCRSLKKRPLPHITLVKGDASDLAEWPRPSC